MATKTKSWTTGTGSATIQYGGQGDGQITITSDPNSVYEARSMQITVGTTDGSGISRTITINQAAKQRIDLSAAIVTAATQTYSGSAKTPTPTVTLNGSTVPSSGYDVAYNNNTNAGTATITITGKGDYTGTATGTFTIAPAAPSYTAPTAKTLTYSGSSQSLVNAGTASGGTMYYYATTTNSKPSSTSSFSSSIPSKTNAGTYYVWYYVKGDSNHTDTAISSTSVSVTISKATPVISTAPSKRTGLSYTGSAQNLLSGGSVKHSSSDSTSVSGTFTYAQGTNAGTYSSLTWSFTPSSSSNYNSISGTVSGSVTIAKASRTMSWSSYPSSLYVGRTGTLSATASAGSSDGTISYSSSNSSKASVSGSTVTAVASGTCTIYASISEGTNYLSASTSYTLTVNAIPSGFVDMGVSVLWADKNIGASSVYTYDCSYFSWGNIDGHTPSSTTSFSPYDWGTANDTEPYKSSSGASITTDIPLSKDAARQNLGSPCRMPTKDECKELISNTTCIDANGNEITTTDKRTTVNGIKGLYLKSKINGNRLFLPCTGYGSSTTLYSRTADGYYWSLTKVGTMSANFLSFFSSGIYPENIDKRYHGMAIRAVQPI